MCLPCLCVCVCVTVVRSLGESITELCSSKFVPALFTFIETNKCVNMYSVVDYYRVLDLHGGSAACFFSALELVLVLLTLRNMVFVRRLTERLRGSVAGKVAIPRRCRPHLYGQRESSHVYASAVANPSRTLVHMGSVGWIDARFCFSTECIVMLRQPVEGLCSG